MNYERDTEPVEATVADLRPRMRNITITFRVVGVGDEREVVSRSDGSVHRVADAVVGDSTGTVQVPLWDETIDEVEVGETYVLTNGYTGLFRGNLRLNIGRYGQLARAEEPIEEVNTETDMSAAEHDDPRRPRRDYGGSRSGGFSSSYGGRSYGGSSRRGRYSSRGRGRRY